MAYITKIKLFNFKKFENLIIDCNEDINIIIGDNEAGKSSILLAIHLVVSGSKNKVEVCGLDRLFNTVVIDRFLSSAKRYEDLPKLTVEIYLSDGQNAELNGRNNTERQDFDGLTLCCEPDDHLSNEIRQILAQPGNNFPFEYYKINFTTFAGTGYTSHRRFLRHVTIDSSQINNDYATREYIKDMYLNIATNEERHLHTNQYRQHKLGYANTSLQNVNQRLQEYSFGVRNGHKDNLQTDLTLNEGSINIEDKGKGKQCFIKTQFALTRAGSNLDIILLEEPENHLSHLHMKKLISDIRSTTGVQMFITTHNNMVSTRLDLRKAILLNSISTVSVVLQNLQEDTAKFFIKAPDNNVIEFVLSNKVMLVEGDAEYILMDQFCRLICGQSLDQSGIHVISVDGTSFKRYLQLAQLLGIRTAIVRDNDGDYNNKCLSNYEDYIDQNIKVFAERDNSRSTFETCIYADNHNICDRLFQVGRRTLSVQEYMLANKTHAAFELLDKESANLITPSYIREAIEWLRQ